MTRARSIAAVALALITQPAIAADFISGTWSTADGCQALASTDVESDALYLTATGIAGGAFHCDFVNVAERSGKPGWVATALCQEPGLSYPQLVSILPLEDGRMQVSASQISDVDVAGDYQSCDESAKPSE